ncbi:hypothetical protein M409DRAFT_19806 [Zasmidium cellare ATCC 36951]|uniref:nitric oxide dioxygenase n=1 Tax=Zasmidium cellare ATCC 36951 TaxID=1080233 RepID=A0A6A6CU16_ZASCE|nr:uncharacterized protein M409DRAFT_19806 [Zasmidium cellare ATCC 36951]KAF2170203.1 hypothetical protein M409DRAFT_19806 [Zasmidium cellare ATCC 36951]
MPLTPEQVQIIKSTVPVLQEHGTTITSQFYKTVLEEYPELNNVFNHTNQVNNHQAKALAGALYAYAAHIDDLGALSPAVEKICQKHVSLYIQPEHYKVVGEGLLRAMGIVLGAACTPEVLDAWTAAYWQLADICIGREAKLYSESEGWTDWRDFEIADIFRESDEITSFYLKPKDGRKLPEYLPGQYISLLTDVPQFGYKQSRQYSLSDAPRAYYYRISVKKEIGLDPQDPKAPSHPGWISNILHEQKNVGDVVQLSHPAGDFFYDPAKDNEGPVVLLSAGVGTTPMISILNTLIERGSTQHIVFVHGARTTSAHAFRDHVQQIESEKRNVHSVFFIKNPNPPQDVKGQHYTHEGRLNLATLDSKTHLFLDNKQTKYWVCGPASFMADVWSGLKGLGVEEDRIKLELFGTGELPTK